MIDIRYHISSLAAIFLALSIGIVIGSSFIGNNSSDASARKTVQRYEADMVKLREEIVLASSEAANKGAVAEKYQAFCKAILPTIIKDKLVWKNIAIIQTGDDDELIGDIKHALQYAGANITSTVTLNLDFNLDNTEAISNILISSGLGVENNEKILREKLFGVLAENLAYGHLSEVMPLLETAGFATIEGDYQKSNSSIIIIGGHSNIEKDTEAALVSRLLVSQLEKRQIPTVGCEASTALLSYVPFWKKQGIATIDNADTAIGQTALIYALNGEVANFGIKETSDRFIPQSLEMK